MRLRSWANRRSGRSSDASQPVEAVEPLASAGPAPAIAALSWDELEATDVAAHATALADIAARRLDGITVVGVFTSEECARAVVAMEQHRAEMDPAIFGTMLGVSLADLAWVSDDLGDRSAYLDRAEASSAIYAEAFGFDPFDRVAATLAPMVGGLKVATPVEGGRPYPAANVRWMEPGGGGLPAHVGNEFQIQTNDSADHLRSVTRIRDHYSWFVVLQKPTAGGALSVFDLLFETHVPSESQWGGTGRTDTDFDQMPAFKVWPEPGTLVMFGGGWRWHRVDKVEGTRARVTYGGFAGPSTDGRELHLWF